MGILYGWKRDTRIKWSSLEGEDLKEREEEKLAKVALPICQSNWDGLDS